MSDLELTPEEQAELAKYVSFNAPSPEEKHSIHKFLHDVSLSPDTTKTGYLKEEEIGTPKNPIRTFKNVSIICGDIIDSPDLRRHFENESEIVTSTSLSREAKLLSLAVVQRRELADVSKARRSKKSWFKKKDEKEEED